MAADEAESILGPQLFNKISTVPSGKEVSLSGYGRSSFWHLNDSRVMARIKMEVRIKLLSWVDNDLYWSVALPEKKSALLPNTAIIPIPISMASSSTLKVGVCTPEMMPFALLAVPNR